MGPGPPAYDSLSRLTSMNGGAVSIVYDAYGNVVNTAGATPNEFFYRGEQLDSDLNLYYLRARYYNPATGKFLSQDPWAGDIFWPNSLHRYRYAAGNPVNLIDPTGLAAEVEDEVAEGEIDLAAEKGEEQLANRVNCYLYTAASLLAAVSPEADLVLQSFSIEGDECGAESEFEGERCFLCFAAGTPIHTGRGDVPIEQIEVGDEVIARNRSTGKLEKKLVTALTRPHHDKLLEIRVEGEHNPLRPSTGHPFWVKRGDADGTWMPSGEMRVGDRLQTIEGQWRRITAIKPVPQEETVYNFTVDQDHDYFVGETGFLVHNANCGCSPLDDALRYEQYWQNLMGRAPEQSWPYNIINRYGGGGNLIGATTYDGFGNRAFQYEFPDNTRHGPGYHSYDNEGPNMGCGKGPRSPHIPF